jgi:osmotically-inducible protein OsmY
VWQKNLEKQLVISVNKTKKVIMKKTSGNRSMAAKVFAVIIGLSSLALLCGLTGCAGDRYTQSTGEHIDDNRTSERVKEKLQADTQYKYGDVNVESFKGVVQLSGFVNSRDQKNRAGDLAKNVIGVKTLENKITVKESAK